MSDLQTPGTAEEALSLLKQEPADLIVASLGLAGKKAVDFIEEIKEERDADGNPA